MSSTFGIRAQFLDGTTAGLNRSHCPRLANLQVEIWSTVLIAVPAKLSPTIPAVCSNDG